MKNKRKIIIRPKLSVYIYWKNTRFIYSTFWLGQYSQIREKTYPIKAIVFEGLPTECTKFQTFHDAPVLRKCRIINARVNITARPTHFAIDNILK